MKLNIWAFFLNCVEKIQVSINSDKNNGQFTSRRFTFMTVSPQILLRMRNALDKSCRGNQNTFYVRLMFSENRTVDEIMSKNMVESERTQTILCMHVACWISKTTRSQARFRAHARTHARTHAHALTHVRAHTYRVICNIHRLTTPTMVSWTCLNITLCVHCISCYDKMDVY